MNIFECALSKTECLFNLLYDKACNYLVSYEFLAISYSLCGEYTIQYNIMKSSHFHLRHFQFSAIGWYA